MLETKLFPNCNYTMVTKGNFATITEYLKQYDYYAIDTETTHLNTDLAQLVGVSISIKPFESFYFPVGHVNGTDHNLDIRSVIEFLLQISHKFAIFWNAKYDICVLRKYGLTYPNYQECMVSIYLNNSNLDTMQLKEVSKLYLSLTTVKYKDILNMYKVKDFQSLAPWEGAEYACQDADLTLQLYIKYYGIKTKYGTIWDIDNRLVEVLIYVDDNGIKVDKNKINIMIKEIEAKSELIQTEIYAELGRIVDLNSTQDLGKLLYEELNFKGGDKTEKGHYKVDGETLEILASKNNSAVLRKITEYKHLEKAKNTYLLNLLKSCENKDRVKFIIKPYSAATGRLVSSTDKKDAEKSFSTNKALEAGYAALAVQTIPKPDESDINIRDVFVAEEGYTLVAIDYSNEELRIAANMSHEPVWIQSFLNNEDLHAKMARLMFKIPPNQAVPKNLRTQSKKCTFKILYGGSAYTLANDLKISQEESKAIYEAFMVAVPNFKKWTLDIIETTKKAGGLSFSYFGRPRPLPEILSDDYKIRAKSERQAVNNPVQATAADIMKHQLYVVYKWIIDNNLTNDVKMLLTVHDEIIFEIKDERVPELTSQLCELLTVRLEGWVPLEVEPKIGKTWGTMTPYKFEETKKVEDVVVKKLTFVLKPDINADELKEVKGILDVFKGETPVLLDITGRKYDIGVNVKDSNSLRMALVPYVI